MLYNRGSEGEDCWWCLLTISPAAVFIKAHPNTLTHSSLPVYSNDL